MTFHPDSLPDLTGRTFVVTGGNSGIGQYTVAHLARHGAHVYMGARSSAKADAAIKDIRAEYPNTNLHITHLPIDHLSLSSVVAAAKHILAHESSLHGLINNAGIMATPFALTADCYDVQFQTNYLAHWVLTQHLLPILQTTAVLHSSQPGAVRIVNLSSIGHQQATKGRINFADTGLPQHSAMARYGQSKLANVLHTYVLNSVYGPDSPSTKPGAEIWTSTVHPGLVKTNIGAHPDFPAWMKVLATPLRWIGVAWDSDRGSWTTLYCAASDRMQKAESGAYFQRLADPNGWRSAEAKNTALAERLERWTVEEMRRKGFVGEEGKEGEVGS